MNASRDPPNDTSAANPATEGSILVCPSLSLAVSKTFPLFRGLCNALANDGILGITMHYPGEL